MSRVSSPKKPEVKWQTSLTPQVYIDNGILYYVSEAFSYFAGKVPFLFGEAEMFWALTRL